VTRKWANMDAQARRETRLNQKARLTMRRLYRAMGEVELELVTLRKKQPWYRRMAGRRW
jgi:hypothetical protein